MKKVGIDMMLGQRSKSYYKKKAPRTTILKATLPAGEATKAPPFGSTLGLYGVKADEFCTNFNKESTKYWEQGVKVAILILISPSKTYIIEYKLPTVHFLLDSYLNVELGKADILTPRVLKKERRKDDERKEEIEKRIERIIRIEKEYDKKDAKVEKLEQELEEIEERKKKEEEKGKSLLREIQKIKEKEMLTKKKKEKEKNEKRMAKIKEKVKRKKKEINKNEKKLRRIDLSVTWRIAALERRIERYMENKIELWTGVYRIAVIKSQQTNPIILQSWISQIMGTFYSCEYHNPLRIEKKKFNWRKKKKKTW